MAHVRLRGSEQPRPKPHTTRLQRVLLVSKKPRYNIGQAVSRDSHPSINNPPRITNVAHGKHGSRLNLSTVLVSTFGNPNPSPVAVSKLGRDLKALLSPRPKVSARKFGELASHKLLPIAECRSVVS
jgi:hypothetical protein